MLNKCCIIFFFFFSLCAGAQEKQTEDTIKLATEEFFLLLDNDDVEFANELSGHTFLRDSALYALFDHPDAAKIDSLWQEELFQSNLYSGLRDSLLQVEYQDVIFEELPTDTLRKRLAALDAKTPLNIRYNPHLERVIKNYLKRNKRGMERLMARSAYYFPIFEQRLDKHNIPLEIKYLAIVESALDPRARSRVGATGLWQFMYYTGKMHGLEVNSYIDERMDPVRSTEAAARYLSTLYRVFQDWNLVLASYNSGPGNVSKAIRRSGGSTDYWDLRPYLPRETAAYVPAFLAMMYIFEYAEEHGFQPPQPTTTFFETDTVRVKRQLTFDEISEVTGVDRKLLQFLNPSYKLDVIPYVVEKNYGLRLPREQAGLFVNNEEDIYGFTEAHSENKGTEAGKSVLYTVRKGDFLGRIAQQYGVSVSDLKRWNTLSGTRLKIGQKLLVYPSGNAPVTERAHPEIYTVRRGDSLWSISRRFPGLTIQEIKNLNKMNTNRLKPGMKLKLSQG